MNVRAVAGIWLTFKGRSPPGAGLSQWLFVWRTFTRTASTLLYFPLGNILVQPLSAPFVVKCLIGSPMIKHGFVLHVLDGVQVFWYYCIWNPDTVESRSVGWTADLFLCYSPFLTCGQSHEVKWELEAGAETCQVWGQNPFDTDVIYAKVTHRPSRTMIRADVRQWDVGVRACCGWERSHSKS